MSRINDIWKTWKVDIWGMLKGPVRRQLSKQKSTTLEVLRHPTLRTLSTDFAALRSCYNISIFAAFMIVFPLHNIFSVMINSSCSFALS